MNTSGAPFANAGNFNTINPSVVCQLFSLAVGFVDQVNTFKKSAAAGAAVGPATFKSVEDSATGGFSNITNDYKKFAADMANVGYAIDTSDLSGLGNPLALIASVAKHGGGIPQKIEDSLRDNGVEYRDINKLKSGEWKLIHHSVASKAYQCLLTITGQDLVAAKGALRNTTEGIGNMAELLSPSKLFPSSYSTLLVPVGKTTAPLQSTKPRKVPAGVPLGSPAAFASSLAIALQQVKSIGNADWKNVANAANNLLSLKDLSQIIDEQRPIPTADFEYAQTKYFNGSGTNGFYTIWDVVYGTAYEEMLEYYDINPKDLSTKAEAPCVSFATALHQYGKDQSTKGAADTIRLMVDQTTSAGQAILAALREGNNVDVLRKNNMDATLEIDSRGAMGDLNKAYTYNFGDGDEDVDIGVSEGSLLSRPNSTTLSTLTLNKNGLDFYTFYNKIDTNPNQLIEFHLNMENFKKEQVFIALNASHIYPHPIHHCEIERNAEVLFSHGEGVVIERSSVGPGVFSRVWDGATISNPVKIENSELVSSLDEVLVQIEYSLQGSILNGELKISDVSNNVIVSQTFSWPTFYKQSVFSVVGVSVNAFTGCSTENLPAKTVSPFVVLFKHGTLTNLKGAKEVPPYSSEDPAILTAVPLVDWPDSPPLEIANHTGLGYAAFHTFTITKLGTRQHKIGINTGVATGRISYLQWIVDPKFVSIDLYDVRDGRKTPLTPQFPLAEYNRMKSWADRMTDNSSLTFTVRTQYDALDSNKYVSSHHYYKTNISVAFSVDGERAPTETAWFQYWHVSVSKTQWQDTMLSTVSCLENLPAMLNVEVFSDSGSPLLMEYNTTHQRGLMTTWNVPIGKTERITLAAPISVGFGQITAISSSTPEVYPTVWKSLTVSEDGWYSLRIYREAESTIGVGILIKDSEGKIIANRWSPTYSSTITNNIVQCELVVELSVGTYYVGARPGTLPHHNATLQVVKGRQFDVLPNVVFAGNKIIKDTGGGPSVDPWIYPVSGQVVGKNKLRVSCDLRSSEFFTVCPSGRIELLIGTEHDALTDTAHGILIGSSRQLDGGSAWTATHAIEYNGTVDPDVVSNSVVVRNPDHELLTYDSSVNFVSKQIAYEMIAQSGVIVGKKTVVAPTSMVADENVVLRIKNADTVNNWSVDVGDVYARWEGDVDITQQDYAIVFANWGDEAAFFEPLIGTATQLIQAGPASSSARRGVADTIYADIDTTIKFVIAEISLEEEIARAQDPCQRDLLWSGPIKEELRTQLRETGLTTFITHSPWGEYGHPNNRYLAQIMHELGVEEGWSIWHCALAKTGGYSSISPSSDYSLQDVPTGAYSLEYFIDGNAVKTYRDAYHDLTLGTFDGWQWLEADSDLYFSRLNFFRSVNIGAQEVDFTSNPVILAIMAIIGTTYTC